MRIYRKGALNESAPAQSTIANSVCWLANASGNGRSRLAPVVDSSGARLGMDRADSGQLASNGARSIGPRGDQGSKRSDLGAKPRELRSGFLPAGNGERLSRAFRPATVERTSRDHQRDAEGRKGAGHHQDRE